MLLNFSLYANFFVPMRYTLITPVWLMVPLKIIAHSLFGSSDNHQFSTAAHKMWLITDVILVESFIWIGVRYGVHMLNSLTQAYSHTLP